MESAAEVRIDKWLWAVRIFKTRSLATTACRAGHVKMNGENLKPSHTVKVGQIFAVRTAELTRTLKVTALLDKRVGAKLVSDYMEDLTPAAEYLRAAEDRTLPQAPRRAKGAGRPTKKERRQLESLF
jgi:ribosome-associated heat shock protein Hsp15